MDKDDLLPGTMIAHRNPNRLYSVVEVTPGKGYQGARVQLCNEQSGYISDIPLLDLSSEDYEIIHRTVPDYPPDFATL